MKRATDLRHSKRVAPGPSARFLLGNLREFRRDPLGSMGAWREQYGDLVRFRLGPKVFHVISHPELAEEVLIRQKELFVKTYDPGKPKGLALVLGNGLITSDGELWHRQRRAMQPFFSCHRLAAMAVKMTEAGERTMRRWEQRSPRQSCDIASEMMQLTLEVITQTMFTTSVLEHAKTIGPALKVALKFAVASQQNPFLPPLIFPTRSNLEFKRAMNTLDKLIYRLIDQRREAYGDFDDLLDVLIRTCGSDSSEQADGDRLLRDEMMTIFSAGHETTANALSWTWYLLARHPNVRSRLEEELKVVLGGRNPGASDLPRLSYARQVLEESLRLYPPAVAVLRRTSRDAMLWDYKLPENSLVIVNFYGIHRHPEFWNDPETFNPNRFAQRPKPARHRFAFVPFGAGPRACIGKQFAMLEAHLLLAMIARRFELRLASDHPVEKEVSVSLRPKHGLPMTVHRI